MMVIELRWFHGVESRIQDCLGFPYTEGKGSAIWSLKSQVWFQTKIARRKVQLPLTTAILKSQNSVSSNILPIDQVAGLLKSGNKKAFTSILSSKHEMMRCRAKMVRFKKEMKRFRTWMMRFTAKNSLICKLITLLRANQIAGIASDFKMDIINI